MIELPICHDCSKEAKIKTCETHNPRGAQICKQCCIARGGHKCLWFSICWV